MKWILVLLFLGSTAMADTETVLKECSITCSARCKDYAQEIKKMADDILDNCGSGSGSKAAIIDACSHAGFSYQSDVQTCISNAETAEAVNECAHAGFSYQSDIQTCISNMGSKDSDIVVACKNAGFSYQSDIQTCISTASYAADVTACAHSGFSYQSQILECIKSN